MNLNSVLAMVPPKFRAFVQETIALLRGPELAPIRVRDSRTTDAGRLTAR